MKRQIRASYYDEYNEYDGKEGQDNQLVTETLTRTLTIYIDDVEIEVDGDSIDFSNLDWAAADGDGAHESEWVSEEDDPEIVLDDTSGVADKVTELLLGRIFEHVNKYRTYNIDSCKAELVYLVPDVQYEASPRGVYEHGDVSYNSANIFWSEADSTIECDWSRL